MTTPTHTEWQDEFCAQRERLLGIPDLYHPAARHLIEALDKHIETGLQYGYITETEAARA